MDRLDGAMFAEVEVVVGGVFFCVILFGDGSAASEFDDLLLSVSLWVIVSVVGAGVFVLFSREERLISRGLSHGCPSVLFPVGLRGRLVGLFCLLLCSFSVVCSFFKNFLVSPVFLSSRNILC